MMSFDIPNEVQQIGMLLEQAGFEAYLVGGCVRDLLLGRTPKDWDVATNATPEQTVEIFPDSVYENEFGTVGVKIRRVENETSGMENEEAVSPLPMSHSPINIIEVTTYRIEGRYTDKRHPDEVKFAKTIEEDLSRRDFTCNAMALRLEARNMKHETEEGFMLHASGFMITDPYGGQQDIKDKIIRTVGKPDDRFNEDALRLVRAVRFACELDFQIDLDTRRAIEKHSGLLEVIAKERIRDEFVKIVMSERAGEGVMLLEELNLLQYILPELREGIGVAQNLHHIYTVFEHHVRALDYTAKKGYSLIVRLSALFHDLGKPKTKAGEGKYATFYNHERVSAKMALAALDRLRFPKEVIEQVAHLVRYHMFYYNVGEVTPAGVRRFLARVGPEYVDDLIKLREADRIGSGTPKAVPYKLRHFLFMIEKVKADPVSAKMLKANGEDVMRILGISPGPKIGQILAVLLEEVLDDPEKNSAENLESRIKELGGVGEKELIAFAKKAKEKKEEFEGGIEEDMKKKFYVQ